MLLVDRIKENDKLLDKEPKPFLWSCIHDLDNNLMYVEISKNNNRLQIDFRQLKDTCLVPEAIAGAHIDCTVAQTTVSVLDRTQWHCEISDKPFATLSGQISAREKCIYIDDFMVKGNYNRNDVERKMMLFLGDLCANVDCKTIKALPTKERCFKGSVIKDDDSQENYFTTDTYKEFLERNHFEKKALSGCYSKEVESHFHLFDMTSGKFGVFNKISEIKDVLKHIQNSEHVM